MSECKNNKNKNESAVSDYVTNIFVQKVSVLHLCECDKLIKFLILHFKIWLWDQTSYRYTGIYNQ